MEQQERLIQTTTELKKALMQKLFTEGTRGEPQKQTEIGPVPKSWDVVTLGSLGKIGNGSTPKRDNESYWNEGIFPWLTSGKIHEEVIREADQLVSKTALDECHLPRVPANSILVAITGQGKTLGNVARVTFETTVSQHLAYLAFAKTSPLIPSFVHYYLQTKYSYFRQIAGGGGSTKGALTCGFLKTVEIPVPPEGEQNAIVDPINKVRQKIELHDRKLNVLGDLFKTLLHKLMTAEIRVHEIDLPGFAEKLPND